MAAHPAWTIYKKELLDTLRDRRTLAAMLLVPMVAYPLALLVTSQTLEVERRAQRERRVVVELVTELPRSLVDGLGDDADLSIAVSTGADDVDDVADRKRRATAALKGGADIVLAMSATAAEAFDGLGTAKIELFFDPTTPFSDAGVRRVERRLERLNEDARAARMSAADLPPSAADPLSLSSTSVATKGEVQNQFFGSLLPALVLVFIAISCFYPAVDLTAGEKERKTLATLLTAPVATIHLVWGKYLAVVTIGTLAGLLNVTTLGLTLLRVFTSDPSFGAIQFELTGTALVGIGVSIVAIAAPLAAVMLLFACFARSFRDASYLLTPVLLVAAVPAMLSALPSFELTPKLAAIPLANAALLMKATFTGDPPLGEIAIVVVVALATTGALLALVERVFADERVLFSTGGPRADLRSLFAQPPRPSLETALAFAAVVFVLDYYAGLFTAGLSPIAGVVVMQIVGHGLVVLLLAAWMRSVVPPRALLGLGGIGLRGGLGAVAIGAGAWLGISLPAAWLTALMFPGQAEASEAFSAALDLSSTPLLALILALAIVPAIAEELLFRGAIYRLMTATSSARAAVVAQALVFGVFHGSIYRFLPTALLGLVLGELRRRTGSVVPGMIAHAMTNAIILLIDQRAPEDVTELLTAPTLWAFAGLALVALAHAVVDSRARSGVEVA